MENPFTIAWGVAGGLGVIGDQVMVIRALDEITLYSGFSLKKDGDDWYLHGDNNDRAPGCREGLRVLTVFKED